MNDDFYSFNLWKIKDGNEQKFLFVWENELAKAFIKLNPYSKVTLIQSTDSPNIYYSFGPWIKLDTLQAARSSNEYRAAITNLVSLCEISKSGSFKNILTVAGKK